MALPSNAEVVYGPISECVSQLDEMLQTGDHIGFISIDVDYWSSTVDCLKIFSNENLKFLPSTPVYFDDVNNIDHHPYAGELLAIKEFNRLNDTKKIVKMNQLRNWRVFKNALYLDQMYWLYNFDSPFFSRSYHSKRSRVRLSNPYLRDKTDAVIPSKEP